MASAAPEENPFQLDFSEAIAENLRQLQRQASREGRGTEFLAAVRTVVHRLQRDPLEFSEPLYRLAVLRMQVRCVVVRPLGVDFAVCDDRPLVFIKAVKLLSK